MQHGRVLRRPAVVVAVLVLAVALLAPWFAHRVTTGSGRVEVHGANAWEASWLWSGAVALAVLAGALTLVRARPVRVAAVGLSVLGLGLAVLQQARLEDAVVELTGSYEPAEPSRDDDPFAVRRGQLLVVELEGYASGPAWGSRAGLVLLTAQVAACAAATVRGGRAGL